MWQRRGRPQPYPHSIDILVVLPFVIGAGGNVLDLYSLWWFDDVAHFLNGLILVSAFALALQGTSLGKLPAWSIPAWLKWSCTSHAPAESKWIALV